jgi:hypothetical protein
MHMIGHNNRTVQIEKFPHPRQACVQNDSPCRFGQDPAPMRTKRNEEYSVSRLVVGKLAPVGVTTKHPAGISRVVIRRM